MSTSCSVFMMVAPNRLTFLDVPRHWARFLLYLGAVLTVAECFTATPPTGYERSQNEVDTSEAHAMPEVSWRGYPRLFTEKTSSLLSEALHMLHRAKDIQERRWLQTFVQRMAQLASDLERSTQDYRSSPVVLSEQQILPQQQLHKQQTVPTTGQISPPPSPSSLDPRVATTTQGSVLEEIRGLGKPEVVTKPNFVSDEGDSLTRQLREERPRAPSASSEARGAPGVGRHTTETYNLESVGPASMKPTTPLNDRDVSFFLDRIHTLVGLGMSEEDVGRAFKKRTGSRADAADPKEDGAKTSFRMTSAPAEAPASVVAVPGMSGSPREASSASVARDDLVRQLESRMLMPAR